MAEERREPERYGPSGVIISNSDKSRVESQKTERPVVSRVVQHQAKIKEDTFWDKFKKAWFGEDVKNVGDHLIFGIGIPAMKATISDMVSNGINIMLFGETGSRSRRDPRSSGYSGYYRRESDRERESRKRDEVGYIWEQVEPMSKSDVLSIIAKIRDIANDYEYVTQAELLSALGFGKDDIDWTDEGLVWYMDDLRGPSDNFYRTVRGGYLLDLPRPKKIKSR